MGFYAPAQIVRDFRNHGVEARPADINASIWDNSLERDDRGRFALRLGFRQIDGFRQDWADTLALEREAHGRFDSVEALARRANLPQRALRLLADAAAFGPLAPSRRVARWEGRRPPGSRSGGRRVGEESVRTC